MAETGQSNLATARRYVDAIERGAEGDALAAFYATDVRQEEFPNRLVPTGATRDLTALLDAAVRGKRAVSAQRYEVRNAVATGDQVVLEFLWTGTLAVAFGSLPIGGTMRAHIAIFLGFRDGKIVAQRNYDCFEPW